MINVDRTRFKDTKGRLLTQSLFLEYQYNMETAIYSLSDEDKEYKGQVFPSLRRLYMEMSDPTEYEFATKYFYDWAHWLRICDNVFMAQYIDVWREELEVKIRAQAISRMLKLESNFNAIKWAADGHWNVKRGRPSKEEKARDKAIREKTIEGLDADAARILHLVPKDKNNG